MVDADFLNIFLDNIKHMPQDVLADLGMHSIVFKQLREFAISTERQLGREVDIANSRKLSNVYLEIIQ